MAVYIELDELAANALIAVQKSGRRFVSYRAMEEYGLCVADILREKGIRMILSLSRDCRGREGDFPARREIERRPNR